MVMPLEPAKSAAGILLAPAYEQPSGQGTVLAVGGAVDEPEIKPGARVAYNWLDARELPGRVERLLDWERILAVVD